MVRRTHHSQVTSWSCISSSPPSLSVSTWSCIPMSYLPCPMSPVYPSMSSSFSWNALCGVIKPWSVWKQGRACHTHPIHSTIFNHISAHQSHTPTSHPPPTVGYTSTENQSTLQVDISYPTLCYLKSPIQLFPPPLSLTLPEGSFSPHLSFTEYPIVLPFHHNGKLFRHSTHRCDYRSENADQGGEKGRSIPHGKTTN